MPRGYKTNMSSTGSYHLGKRKGSDTWHCVRVYRVSSAPFTGPFDEFLLGEPVNLKSVRLSTAGSTPEDAIWWIHEFLEIDGEGKAELCSTRERTPGCLLVPVLELEKLNAMERLAIEYAF